MNSFQATEPSSSTLREIEWPSCTTAAASPRRAPRSARLPKLIGAPGRVGDQLAGLRALVVGCGSVGGVIADHITRLQPAELCLVDPAKLKPESLLTHRISPSSVGQGKAEHFGRLAKSISPTTRVTFFDGPVESLPDAVLAGVDIACMATDNIPAEIEVGQRCMHHRIPLIQGAVHGETLVAQARVWHNRDASGACPACGMGASDWAQLDARTRFSCASSVVSPVRLSAPAPTRSVSCLCSLAADLATLQLLRMVLQLSPAVEDSVTELSAYQPQVTVSPLRRDTACPCDHTAWDRHAVPGPLGQYSLRQLLELTGLQRAAAPRGRAFIVDQLEFVTHAVCCESRQLIGRFCVPDAPVGQCLDCRQPLYAQRLFSHRVVSARTLGPRLEEPLRALGAAAARSVVLCGRDRTLLCHEEIRK
jgi:molybdopterin/thiamine biosynthesis adenylyltransferase